MKKIIIFFMCSLMCFLSGCKYTDRGIMDVSAVKSLIVYREEDKVLVMAMLNDEENSEAFSTGHTVSEAVEQIRLPKGQRLFLAQCENLLIEKSLIDTDMSELLGYFWSDIEMSLEANVCIFDGGRSKSVSFVKSYSTETVYRLSLLEIARQYYGEGEVIIPIISEDGKEIRIVGGAVWTDKKLGGELTYEEMIGIKLLNPSVEGTPIGVRHEEEDLMFRINKSQGKKCVKISAEYLDDKSGFSNAELENILTHGVEAYINITARALDRLGYTSYNVESISVALEEKIT